MKSFELKIKNKVALVMIIFALAIVSLLTALYYFQFKQALKERMFLQLSSVKQLKFSQIHHRLENILKDFNTAEIVTEERRDIDGLIHYGHIRNDTVINTYPISIPEGLEQTEMIDLTTYDRMGKITIALLKNNGNRTQYAVVQPNIQSILLERTGLGETGESYLVGADTKMRSSSRFFPDKRPTDIVVDTDGVKNALTENEGNALILDYRGVSVFSAYERLDFAGITWVILSEIDEQEALFPLKGLRNNLLIVLAIMLVFVFGVSYEISRQLVKPVLFTEQQLQKMSRGIFELSFRSGMRDDEIGQMFRALERLIRALQQTVVFANEIGSGNFKAHYDLLSKDDRLGAALLDMKERLQAYQENEKRLKLENQRSLISGEEKERARLSRELHDGLGPLLTILRIKVESSKINEADKVELLKLFDDTLGEMRKISNNLMPSVLTDFGAGEAIRNLVGQIDTSSLKIRYQYDKNENLEIPPNVSIALYRVAQEALNNALKHARASQLNISLTEFPDRVSLYVQDDGHGFDPGTVQGGNGLRNMRERVNVESGIFEISSNSRGSVIEVEIPIT